MPPARRRRWPWLLGAFVLFALVAGIWVNAQLEPNRLAATVLGKAGEALQLKLAFHGTPEYAFKPEPRLVLPGFTAAGLDGQVFLSARRAEISLPWSTITGDEPVITRIQLDTPVLQVAGLKRWLASRPPTPFKLPTLRRGLSVSNATIVDDSWTMQVLSVELPHLKAGDPAKLGAAGRLLLDKTAFRFELDAMISRPGLESPLDFKLTVTPEAAPGVKPAPISLVLAGRYAWADPRFTLEASKLALVASSPLPSFEGKGRVQLADQTVLGLDVVLTRWPEAWPKLPGALAAQGEQLPVQLTYRGKTDFSDPLSLVATRDATELRASLRVPEMREWLAAEHASPLPPLRGTLKTPSLDFDGIQLEGVEVEIGEGGSGEAAP